MLMKGSKIPRVELSTVHLYQHHSLFMPNKLQYTWRGDYCKCVRPAQIPVLTWGSSSVPLGTTSMIRSSPGPRRILNRTTFEDIRIVACEYSRVFVTSCWSVCSYVWSPCCLCLQGPSTPVKVIIAIFLQYPTFALQVVRIVWIMQEDKSEHFVAFLTVHHNIDLFQVTKLMHTFFLL